LSLIAFEAVADVKTAMPMSMLLFSGYDANGNDALWVTDGTAAGTWELFVQCVPQYGLLRIE
jgi:hypothetical protein